MTLHTTDPIARLEQTDYENQAIANGLAEYHGDIIIAPFWTPDFCAKVVEAAEYYGGFQPLPEDVTNNAAPGRELRIPNFSPWLFEKYKEHWLDHLKRLTERFYQMKIFSDEKDCFRAPFILKYSMDGQREMDQHHDFSLISMSVKLNDKFEGSELVFPRQGWSNKEVPVGYAVIFPGLLTHPHYAAPLLSGTRYGLTGWIRAPHIDRRDTL